MKTVTIKREMKAWLKVINRASVIRDKELHLRLLKLRVKENNGSIAQWRLFTRSHTSVSSVHFKVTNESTG